MSMSENNQPEKVIHQNGVVGDLKLREGSQREQNQSSNVTTRFRLLIVVKEERCGLQLFPALNVDFES